MEELLKKLKELANKRCVHENDDFNIQDYGNYDDAYRLGERSGEIELAREVLAVLDPSFEVVIEPE